jgi:coproporphyrinogen III oxidase
MYKARPVLALLACAVHARRVQISPKAGEIGEDQSALSSMNLALNPSIASPRAHLNTDSHAPKGPISQILLSQPPTEDNDGWFFAKLLGGSIGIGGLLLTGKLAAKRVHSSRTQSPQMTAMQHREAAQTTLTGVQEYFVRRLEAVTADGAKSEFQPNSWVRDEGTHGGGQRYGVVDVPVFNRASVNYSGVFYDDKPDYPVSSATAISVIIHPRNPHAPSMHCHFSYTEPRNKAPYWRMISDLNPSLHNPDAKNKFENKLREVAAEHGRSLPPQMFENAKLFGDKYFFIPELNMYRGTSHFFIPELPDSQNDPSASRNLAEKLAKATIDTYTSIIQERMDSKPLSEVTDNEKKQQLAYHTAYFYQVLFLDRGTTAGLMAHSDNDVGTLASLPNYIDRKLLETWLKNNAQPPHDVLLSRILDVLPKTDEVHITDDIRAQLAKLCRDYYLEDKSRPAFQASMDVAAFSETAYGGSNTAMKKKSDGPSYQRTCTVM